MRVFLTLPAPRGQQDQAIWQFAMQDRTIVDFGETSGVRGVSVLSPCSHAGVVNAALGAQGAFGGEPIDVILGGYHLAGEGMEPRIEPTVHDLANRVRPRVVAPGHCTGWRAKAALAHTFAPGNYGPSVVGSLYALRAT
jgi:7,8-dihydropterin-6-yl-methyl-4-(beta-D-ribofuranosyl)aminobenzene 5'-phosphate synthase